MWPVIASLLLAAPPNAGLPTVPPASGSRTAPQSSAPRAGSLTAEPRPASPIPEQRRVVVVVEDAADSAQLAGDAVSALERVGLQAETWDPSAFFDAQPKRCSSEVRCLCDAPALTASPEVLVLRVSRLSAQLRAVDLRRLDCADFKHGARISLVLDATELTSWVEKFAPRLMLAVR